MQLENIQTGQAYACRFRTTTFLDSEGKPVRVNLQVGQAHPGMPGTYESIGIIKVRDLDNQLVQLIDTQTELEFTVAFVDCWDIDTVEYV